jgi:spore coat protein H
MIPRRSVVFALVSPFFLAAAGCENERARAGGKTPGPTPVQTPATPTPGPTPTPAAACHPSESGPHWVEEGDTVTFEITCTSGMEALIVLDSPPAGAEFDPAAGVFTWTPGLADAAVHELEFRVPETGESRRVRVGVADRWQDDDNVPVVDPSKYTHELGLPVLFLAPGPEDDDEYAPATVVYGGHTYAVDAKKRGVTSMSYPKNSYTLRFAKEDKFHDAAHGFDGVRRLAVTQTFDDNSYLRNRLAFAFWNRLDPAHVQIRAFSAVIYVDGEYWGLYTISNHIDDNLMEENGLGEGGHLFKAASHSANWDTYYQGAPKTNLAMGFLKKEGLPEDGMPGAYDVLEDAVEFVGSSSESEFLSGIDNRIETRDYMHWWILVRLLNAEDSGAKNSFHYLPAAPGAKWRYIPWDFNASFGQSWRTLRREPDWDNDFSHRNEIFARLLASHERKAQLDALYREALDGPWKLDDLLAIVDEMAAEIGPSAKRDELKWGGTYRDYGAWSTRSDFTDWEGEVEYLRGWLIERWEFESRAH